MKWFFSVCAFLFLSLFFIKYVSAETISNYSTFIQVNKDATLKITESLDYDYESTYKHGIIRYIPFTIKNINGKKYTLDISNISVTSTTQTPTNTNIYKEGEDIVIKIGDKNTTITGLHNYTISYIVKGAIRYFSDHDEVYWNAIGTKWNVPITNASVKIIDNLPNNPKNNPLCFKGVDGSNSPCEKVQDNSFTTTNLNAYEGITIAQSYPKDFLALVEPKEYVPFVRSPLGIFLEVIAGLFGLIFLINFLKVPKVRTVTAYFDIPKTKSGRILTPIELGALADGSADPKDIVALLVGLAQKGYLKIKEENEKQLIGSKKIFTLELIKNLDETLTLFEKRMLHGFFSDIGEKINPLSFITHNSEANKDYYQKMQEIGNLKTQLPKITKNTFTFDSSVDNSALYAVQQYIKDDTFKQLIADNIFRSDPRQQQTIFFITAFAITFLGGFLAQPILFFTGFISIFLGVFLVNITSQFRKVLTPFGLDLLGQTLSLKNFLKSQERQLNFQGDKQMLFEKFLPYAVAFGVEKNWAERFKDMNLQNPSWYNGSNGSAFNAVAFGSSLHSFSTTVSSTGMSSASSGGSSGSGGGGGGGSSW